MLSLGRRSSFLAFSIGVALAAPLPTYLRLKRGKGDTEALNLTETAVFNYSGDSSSGKTSCGLAAISLAGSPDRVGTMNFSERGLAEHAAGSNDIVVVADDTEKSTELAKALRLLTHQVPSGRSKQISKGSDQSAYPELRYSTLVLSSSPRPVSTLAKELGWTMTAGDKVRIFDIPVPPPEAGGIFDRISGSSKKRAKRSVKLIAKLENGYVNHCGHVIPAWIELLLSKNYTPWLAKRVRKFVHRVGAQNHGWQNRAARKFGLVYAAMKLATKAGILPWPKVLPYQVAFECYRLAQAGSIANSSTGQFYATKLRQKIRNSESVVDVSKKATSTTKPAEVPPNCIAIRYKKGGRVKLGVFDDALTKLVESKTVKSAFISALEEAGVIKAGKNGLKTKQVRVVLLRGERVISSSRQRRCRPSAAGTAHWCIGCRGPNDAAAHRACPAARSPSPAHR